ncbi:MAG: hypothetical protein ACJ8DI_02355 [Ktedonobacteraceae bacterium]
MRTPVPPQDDRTNKHTEGITWLPRRELGVGDWSGKIGGRSLGSEPDDCTVDVDPCGSVRSGLAGGRVDARQQVGPSGRQVEDDVLIDLPRVESRFHRLVGPQTELRVPQRAVRVGMPGVT